MGVGLEPVAQGDAGHAQAAGAGVVEQPRHRVELLLVEPADELGHDRAEQDRAGSGAARGQVGVAERHPPGRHVPPGVADVQLGEDHGPSRVAARLLQRYRRSTMAWANSEVFTSVAPSISRAKS